MKDNYNSSFSDFLRSIPEGNKQIHYSPGYLKITSTDGKNVYVYKLVDGVYRSCSYQKKKPSRKIFFKTKKGKIKTKYLAYITAAFTMSACMWNGMKHLESNQTLETKIEQSISKPEESDFVNRENIQIIIENEQKESTTKLESANTMQEKEIENNAMENISLQTLSFEIIQSREMQSRNITRELYGQEIKTYSQKYGLNSALVEALITQERHKESLDNPGQLTRDICGEEIIIPIIQKNFQDTKEVEKIFIVREEPLRGNFENETEYIKQLNRYKEQLERSKSLATKGFEIISFESLKGEANTKENIRISIIWLAHCIYKCNCQINKGIFAYNQGYPEARISTDTEIMNGLAGSEKADIWYNYNVLQFLTKEEAQNLNFFLKPFPEEWQNKTESEKRKYLNEISQIPVQNISLSIPIFNESLEEKYTNEKENGHSL